MRAQIVIPKGYSRRRFDAKRRKGDLLFDPDRLLWVFPIFDGVGRPQCIYIRPLATRSRRARTKAPDKGLLIPGFPAPKGRRWLRVGEPISRTDRYHSTRGGFCPPYPPVVGSMARAPSCQSDSPLERAPFQGPGHYSRALSQ